MGLVEKDAAIEDASVKALSDILASLSTGFIIAVDFLRESNPGLDVSI